MNINDKYQKIIDRFFEKSIDNDELDQLKNWLSESAENRSYFDRLNEAYIASGDGIKQFYDKVDVRWNEMKSKISLHSLRRGSKSANKTVLIWKIVAAASIIVGLVLAISGEFMKQESSIAQVVTSMGHKTNLQLTDGTNVWLNAGSKLKSFDKFRQREVYISGEVYFDVEYDENKPFVVHAGNTEVRVYGTRFNICAYDDEDDITVTLEEGKVGMKIKNQSKIYIMNPGENIVYNRKTKMLKRTKVNTTLFTSWKNNKLKFSNATFEEVVAKIERWYGVKVHVDKNIKYSERFTMTIHSESLRELLKLMTKVAPIKYKIEEDHVFINHKNSKPMDKN